MCKQTTSTSSAGETYDPARARSKSRPSESQTEDDTDLSEWLTQQRLNQYAGKLAAEGYDDLEVFLSLDEEDLDDLIKAINMKPGHQKKLLKLVSKEKWVSPIFPRVKRKSKSAQARLEKQGACPTAFQQAAQRTAKLRTRSKTPTRRRGQQDDLEEVQSGSWSITTPVVWFLEFLVLFLWVLQIGFWAGLVYAAYQTYQFLLGVVVLPWVVILTWATSLPWFLQAPIGFVAIYAVWELWSALSLGVGAVTGVRTFCERCLKYLISCIKEEAKE